MCEATGDTINWKKLWQLTAGFNNESSTNFVENTLLRIKDNLKIGLLYYKPCSRKSLEKLKTDTIKDDFKLKTFFERLEKFVGLDALQLWDILCYYLVTEFRGSPTALVKFTISETKVLQLLVDIWGFYSSERMFMLKLLGVLIEYNNSESHPYRYQYKLVLNAIGLEDIRDSLLKQFEGLIREPLPTVLSHGDICTLQMQRLWAERNMRELIQVLNLLIVVVGEVHMTSTQLEELIILFKEHNFGREPRYLRILSEKHADAIQRISHFEAVLFLTCMDTQNFAKISMETWIGKMHKSLDQLMITLHYNEEHSVFLLSWMLFNYNFKGKDAFHNRYSQFGIKALQLNVFEFLTKVLRNVSFKDKSKLSKTAYRIVYNLLIDMCENFDCDGSVSHYPFVYELCSELLSVKFIAMDFLANIEKGNGITTIWNSAVEMFPYEFNALSQICDSLAKCGDPCHQFVMQKLSNLPIFTELHNNACIRIIPFSGPPTSEQYILEQDHQPLASIDYKIPAGSRVLIRDIKKPNTQLQCTLIQFGALVTYWKVLHSEIIQLLEGTRRGSINPDIDLFIRVESGIKLIAVCMKNIKKTFDVPEQLVYPTEMVFDLTLKYMISSDPPVDLLTSCLNVFASLVPLFGDEIQKKLCRTNLLPSISNFYLHYKEYARGESFHSNGMGNFLINVAKPTGQFKFIVAYMNLLSTFFNKHPSSSVMEVRMPGLIFILLDLFPHVSTWHFNDENERHNILFSCAQIFLKILQSDQSDDSFGHEILHKTLVYSLLNIENGTALLKLVAVGNPYLQALMEEQTNWVTGPGIQKIRLVQTAIAILMQILRLKRLVLEKDTLAPLEHIIYTQPKQKDALRIVPIVTGYMNHIFNKHLPSLACRLLKRFALEIQMSLMACLDMESDQIRQMFLERLRDETENEDLKTAILELVAACVKRQPGLTEAFFKVYHPQEKLKTFYKSEKHDVAEGVLSYMAEYLSVVHKDPLRLNSPLLTRIMNLFHSLWKNHMEMLVSDFRQDEKFWNYFTTPLFSEICPDTKAYSQILNIISLELFKNHGLLDKNLKTSLEILFDKNKPHLKSLLDHVFAIPTCVAEPILDETPEWLSLLTSWKDFLTIAMKFLPFKLDPTVKGLCFIKCLEVLNSQIVEMKDLRTVIILSELCMVSLSYWRNESIYGISPKILSENTIKLIQNIFVSYDLFHMRAKEALLSTTIYLINSLEDLIKTDNTLSVIILEPLCRIVCLEIRFLTKECNNASDRKESTLMCHQNLTDNTSISQISNKKNDIPKIDHDVTPAVLSFSAITQLLILHKGGSESWRNVMMETCFVNNILMCLESIVQIPKKMKIAVAAFHTLIHLTRGIFSKMVLDFNVSQYLWLQLLPPKCMVKENSDTNDTSLWRVLDWWQLYRSGIDFVRVALEQNPDFFMQAIVFVSVHEEFILDAILLPRHSMDIHAVQLSVAALELVNEMIKFGKEWKDEHESSYINVMKATQVTADYAISLMHRPRMLKCYVEGITADLLNLNRISVTPQPSTKIVIIMNKLLDLVTLSTRCLYSIGPNLLEMLAGYEINLTKYQPLVDMQFGAPKLSSLVNNSLTFGTVMSAVCLFTKVLNQSYKKNKKYLNRLRGDVDHYKVEDYSSFEVEDNTASDLFSLKKTVQTIQTTSQIANLSTSGNSMIATTEWLTKFNYKRTLFALENVMAFLAAQTLYTTMNAEITSRDQQLIRRELSTELLSFHEFVRKKILSSEDIMVRKKLGSCKLYVTNHNRNDTGASDEECISSTDEQEEDISGVKEIQESPQSTKKMSEKSMRIDVIRRLHMEATSRQKSKLTPQKRPMSRVSYTSVVDQNIASSTMLQRSTSTEELIKGMEGVHAVVEMSDLSPIKYSPLESIISMDETMPAESTPFPPSTPLRGSPEFFPGTETPSPVSQSDSCITNIKLLRPPSESPIYCPLTDVLMLEEDYLHFLSYLFMYVCPMDSY